MFKADVVIIGAGLVGSSVAMHLSEMGVRNVLVCDVDLEGSFSSSELNAGGVRATWFNPLNAALSKASIDYFEKVRSEIGFRQLGYFWMHSKEIWPKAKAALEQNPRARGLGIEYLKPAEVSKRQPFLDKTEDLGGATFSPKDGLLNPNLLKLHFRNRAKAHGVQFLDRVWIDSAVESANQVTLHGQRLKKDQDSASLQDKLISEPGSTDGALEKIEFSADQLIICTGAWASRFAQMNNLYCPSFAQRRQISIFECKGVDLAQEGMFVDSSGVYFHAEGQNILSGYASPDEPKGYNFTYDGENFFETFIWSPLYTRSSCFESLKHVTGWAGLYEVSPDHSPIIGRVKDQRRIFEAHSFSGRGAMQAYSAGLGLAELLVKKRFETLDLAPFSASRFENGETISERLVI